MRILLAAGLVWGLAHRLPSCPWLAWVAISLLCVGARRVAGVRRAIGLWAAYLLKEGVAFSWLIGATMTHLELSPAASATVAIAVYALCATLRWLPVHLLLCLSEYSSLGRRAWALAAGSIAGDLLVGAMGGFSLGDLLYSQWRSAMIREAVGYYGWWPTSILMIVVSAELVEIRRETHVISAGTVLVGAAMIGAAPPRPDGLQALDGVAALQVASDGEAIECPSTAELLVWPEGHLEDLRRADEGPADYQIDELCSKGSPPASHVIGMVVLGEFGLLNAAAFVDPSSTVRQIRAKRALVPFEGFSHGQEAPILDLQGRAVGVFICFEVLSRSLAAEAVEAGAEFFAVLASDRPLLGSIVAQDQWIAALSMRAAEFGLPAVRASIGGTAVVIDANGHLLRRGRAAGAEFVVP